MYWVLYTLVESLICDDLCVSKYRITSVSHGLMDCGVCYCIRVIVLLDGLMWM